jgi:hypothetical protein
MRTLRHNIKSCGGDKIQIDTDALAEIFSEIIICNTAFRSVDGVPKEHFELVMDKVVRMTAAGIYQGNENFSMYEFKEQIKRGVDDWMNE